MRDPQTMTGSGPVLGRRGLLLGAAAFAALAGRGAFAAEALRAPRRQDLTIGFASASSKETDCPELTTYELTIELESPAEAMRIGLSNTTPMPYTVQQIACCEAAEGHPWIPRRGSPWRRVGFGGRAGAVTVPGNQVAATGATNVPAVLWSDWVPYRTAGGGRAQMLFRFLVPPQTLPLTLVGWPPDSQDVLPAFPPRLRDVRQLAGDYVTDPVARLPRSQRSHYVPMFALQYRSAAPGIQLVLGGDSHPAQWNNFAQLAAMQLSTPAQPMAMWNVAWGAQPSRTFWPLLEMAIGVARPSVSVIEGWTANDGPKPEAWLHYIDEVRQSIALTRQFGGVPVVFTGMPRKLYGSRLEPQWQHYNEELGRRLPGAVIFDVDRYVEDPGRPGDWRPGFSREGIHPNPQANATLAPPFEQLLQSLM